MKKSTITAVKVAVLLIFIGALISIGALIALGFDFTRMNSISECTNEYTIEQEFTEISVKGAECDIRLLVSWDDSCRVFCNESDKIVHTVGVENGALTIRRNDTRKWYERIGIYWSKMEILIYLPQTEYESLYASTLSGKVAIPSDFSFGKAEIRNTSGGVDFRAYVENDLFIKTVSGKIYAENSGPKKMTVESTSGGIKVKSVKPESEFKVKNVSGAIELTDVECKNARAESSSGKIILSNLIASGDIHLESASGAVELNSCDADSLFIKTVSGRVSGSLLSEKIFLTDTVSGRVDTPKLTSGGRCEVKTTSGSIKFTIE